ncbi:hypothetical protein MBLNU457_6171t2 [Dothideomycetes sp. NU457]
MRRNTIDRADMHYIRRSRDSTKEADATLCDLSSTLPTKPVSIPSRNTSRVRRPIEPDTHRQRSSSQRLRNSTATSTVSKTQHQKDALPPSVAALLAMTAIPPPRKTRTRSTPKRSLSKISIDELVQEWKQEAAVKSSVGSHKSMEILLEDISLDDTVSLDQESINYESFSTTRSESSDSLPSLDLDDQSLVSSSEPPTPSNVRSSRASSIGMNKKTKVRLSLPALDTSSEHPLDPDLAVDSDVDAVSSLAAGQPETPRQKTSFRSNITLSLQALKSRALSSLAQLHINSSGPGSDTAVQPYAFSDATLWQNPFLFPRISPEIRPQPFTGTPTKSERRYFNPTPLNFDEQQGHFRQALHAPLNLEGDDNEYLTMIQMKTYNRASQLASNKARKSTRTGGGPNPNSEAGRALAAGGPPSRQREPRENSDFLRVVVLEMNMRRGGKLEETVPGRARIWLPPRQRTSVAAASEQDRTTAACARGKSCSCRAPDANVPARWRSVVVE